MAWGGNGGRPTAVGRRRGWFERSGGVDRSGNGGRCGARAPFVPGAVNDQSRIQYRHTSLRTSQRPRGCRLRPWDGGQAAWAHSPYCRPRGISCMCGSRRPHAWPDGMEPDGRPPPRTLLRAAFVAARGIMGREMFGCRIRTVPEWSRAGWRRRIMKAVGRQLATAAYFIRHRSRRVSFRILRQAALV